VDAAVAATSRAEPPAGAGEPPRPGERDREPLAKSAE
jgi:hypothetical protein